MVEHDPLPAGYTKELAVATLVVYGFEEGRLLPRVERGDKGKAVCAFQVWAGSEARKRELETSPVACVRAAYYIMRENVRMFGDLRGYCGLGILAKQIADKRYARALALVQAVRIVM